MFMLYALVVGLLVGFALGGRPEGLGRLEFRWPLVALLGLAFQIVLFSPPVTDVVGALGPALYVASTVAVLAFIVRNLRAAFGMPIVAAGAVSNLIAIVANGGYMPVTPDALADSGRAAATTYSNSLETSRPAVAWLVDRFAMPAGLPLANVFSIGDVLIAIGIAIVIVVGMRRTRDDVAAALRSTDTAPAVNR